MASAMVPVGRLQVATPASMALAIRQVTEAQAAVDERIAPVAEGIITNNPSVVSAAAAQAAALAQSDIGLVRRGQRAAVRRADAAGISWFSSAVENADGTITYGAFLLDEHGNVHPESAAKIAEAIGAIGASRATAQLTVKGDSMSSFGKIANVTTAWGQIVAGELGLATRLPSVPGEGVTDALFRTGVPIKITGLTQIPATTDEFLLSAAQVNDGAGGHRDNSGTDGAGMSTGGIGQFVLSVLGVPMRFRRVIKTEGGFTLGQWRVNRVTAGLAVPIAPGVPVWAHDAEAAEYRDAMWFFADGRNGMNLTQMIDSNQRVIDWLGHDNWYVLPPVLTTAAEVTGTGKTLVDGLKVEYGEKLLDWQPLMASTSALTMAGLTPTSQDTADLAAGVVPVSLRTDTTHFNDLGLQVWGRIILNLLGY